jgi:nucleotide-binding universal stress UspA family protein
MYDRIAVALDGSVTAYAAIGPARRLARAHDAQLVLVTVATPNTGGTAKAETVLEKGRQRAGVNVDTMIIDHTDAAVALGEFDAADPRTLVCMTTRGRGSARRALLGSTALAVVEHSPYAVVLIGPLCDQHRDTPIDPIVTCLDGTTDAEHILPWASAWSEHTGATILLLRAVYPAGPPGAGDPPSRAQLDDLAYLEQIRQRLRSEHPDIRQVTIPHEQPAVAIREAAHGYDDAMFAVATSHPSFVKELLLGSTAADIIRAARVPVLIVSKQGTSPPP